MSIRTYIKSLVILGLIFSVGCAAIKLEKERTAKQDKAVNKAIHNLEAEGFAGIKGKMKNFTLLFDCKFNDKDSEFLIESGVPFSTMDVETARGIGIISKAEIDRIPKQQSEDSSRMIENFAVNGFEYTDEEVSVVNMDLRRTSLGLNFLINNNSVIFFGYNVLLNNPFDEAESMHDSLLANDYICAPFCDSLGNVFNVASQDSLSNKVYVKCQINDLEQILKISTGSTFSIAYRESSEIQEEISNKTQESKRKVMLHMFTKYINIMQIGDSLFLENTKFALMDRPAKTGDGNIDGILGMDILAREKVILDFGNMKMYFMKK